MPLPTAFSLQVFLSRLESVRIQSEQKRRCHIEHTRRFHASHTEHERRCHTCHREHAHRCHACLREHARRCHVPHSQHVPGCHVPQTQHVPMHRQDGQRRYDPPLAYYATGLVSLQYKTTLQYGEAYTQYMYHILILPSSTPTTEMNFDSFPKAYQIAQAYIPQRSYSPKQ